MDLLTPRMKLFRLKIKIRVLNISVGNKLNPLPLFLGSARGALVIYTRPIIDINVLVFLLFKLHCSLPIFAFFRNTIISYIRMFLANSFIILHADKHRRATLIP